MRRLEDVRALLSLLLLAAAAWGAAAAAPFAALTVTPNGPQRYDITTGVTTLPKGGTVVDQDTGVRLKATYIKYVEGSYIDATGASVSGTFGHLTAKVIHIDVAAGALTASGALELRRNGLTLKAAKLRYDAGRQVVDFTGPVTGTSPDFEADRVLLDAKTGDVLLVGHYSYTDGILSLKSPEAGGKLELHFHEVNGKPVYDAATQVSPALLARFSPELH